MTVPVTQIHRGVGACNLVTGVDCPGTYGDPNCPKKCYVVGDWIDTALFGDECWPCHNICPTGAVWDRNALRCSASPSNPNPGQLPAADTAGGGPECPGYCSWVPFATHLFTECGPCAGNVGQTSGLTTTGIVVASLTGLVVISVVFAGLTGGRRR